MIKYLLTITSILVLFSAACNPGKNRVDKSKKPFTPVKRFAPKAKKPFKSKIHRDKVLRKAFKTKLNKMPSGEVRLDKVVFAKWIRLQQVFKDTQLSRWKAWLNKSYMNNFRVKVAPALEQQLKFMRFPFHELFSIKMTKAEKRFRRLMKKRFKRMDKDFPRFMTLFIKKGFTGMKYYKRDKKLGESTARDKYNKFLKALFYHPKWSIQHRGLFAFANRMFEYAFQTKTFSDFKKILRRKKHRPLIHLMREGIWYYLARIGWQFWHDHTLNTLARLSKKKMEIVYIAGGTDIYHLILRGVYRIRIIDPIFPSQTRYYSEGWRYLIHGDRPDGGIGDKIRFTKGKKKVIMTRVYYKKGKKFKTVKLSNSKVMRLNQSVTIWLIHTRSARKLGYYVLERRFVRQKDFKVYPDQVFLISFNELNFITTLKSDNWGIKPHRFDKSFQFHVKQLRKPVTYKMLRNIRKVQRIDRSFTFGSSIN